jgi:hypothetical protein
LNGLKQNNPIQNEVRKKDCANIILAQSFFFGESNTHGGRTGDMTQECSYREMFITCMQSGAPLPVSLESHEGEKIKEQLKQYSASNIGEEQ